MKRKKSFLQSVCPFTILDSRLTWGEFIGTYLKVSLSIVYIYSVFMASIASAELIGVIK